MKNILDPLRRMQNEAAWRQKAELERFLAEADFAEKLCGLYPRQAPRWRRMIESAATPVHQALTAGGSRLLRAVQDAEKIMAPLQQAAKRYTVHCVGHAHIDMNWMWSWPETVSVTNDTFSTVLRLMDEYPDFTFSQSQASIYAIMERYFPEMLKRIAGRIKEGRWEVTASHWVEGDKNIIGGESLCRHLLYTRRYMQRLFGLKPEDVPIDWSPDTFGHAATVPTYLSRGGVKYLYLHRPGVFSATKPWAFWWEGPDGSRVLVRNDMQVGYNNIIAPKIIPYLVDFVKETGCVDFMWVYGVGDHGGGPTRRDILMLEEMSAWPVFPRLRFSTARVFYEQLAKQSRRLPVLRGEFNTENTGCYTSQSLIKKANCFAENRLVDAEIAASLLWALAGKPYPRPLLEEGWRDTLFSHFHDILPGSCVHDSRTYMHGLFQKTMATTGMVETGALRQLAARVDTARVAAPSEPPPVILSNALGAGVGHSSKEGGISRAEQSAGAGNRPFMIFNPTPWDRDEVVEATVWDNSISSAVTPLKDRTFMVHTAEGQVIPTQKILDDAYWGHDFVTLAFPAQICGLGYGLYTVTEDPGSSTPVNVIYNAAWRNKPGHSRGASQTGPHHHCAYVPYERPKEGLENECLRLDLNPGTGGIRSLYDKLGKVHLVAQDNANPPIVFEIEKPHGMTAWIIDNAIACEWPLMTALRRKGNGPYKAAIEVDYAIRESKFTLSYELRAGDPQLYIRLHGTWFQRGSNEAGVPSLIFTVPFALMNARARYEIPFGAIDRSLNRREEVPALQWAQVTGTAGRITAGCLLLNDSKHGYSLDGSTLRLSLIRASHDPDPLPEIGEHEVHLALRPFRGSLRVSDATRCGRNFNHALRVVGTDVHQGDLPAAEQFASVTPENVILTEVKQSEEGGALVVRLFEADGRPATAKITLNPKLLGPVSAAVETDLLERPLSQSSVRYQGNRISVKVPARGITTLLIKLNKRP